MATIAGIAALAGAGASIYGAAQAGKGGGGVINGNQNDIAYRNYYLQQALQRRQQELAIASQRDARGNVTRYVDGYGWVVDPTETTRLNNTAQDAELRQQLTGDAVRNRMRASATNTRQNQEGLDADALRVRAQGGRESTQDVQALLGNKLVAESMSGIDDLRRRIGIQNLRSGGGTEALAALGRRAIPDTRAALATAAYQAPVEAAQRNAAREAPLMNQYNMLASRATAPAGTTINPASIPDTASAGLNTARYGAIQGNGAVRVQQPTLPNITPNDTAATWGAVLQGIGGVAKNQDVRDALAQWFGSGGQNNSGWQPTQTYNPRGASTASNGDWM